MKFSKLVRRFMPGSLVSLRCLLKFGCKVSPRAEVEVTPLLKIGRGAQISSFTKLKASMGPLTIGKDVQVAIGCYIVPGEAGVEIGDDSLLSPNVVVMSANYKFDRLDVPLRLQGMTSKGIRIGRNVWIGSGACILDGAQIGDGAIVSANAVVSGKVPENAIVRGDPARVVFTRR